MRGFVGSFRRSTVGFALWIAFGVFATAFLGIELTRQSGRVASIWLANAVVLLALLKTPPRKWAAWLLGGLIGNIGANLVTGDASWMAVVLSLCNTFEILLAGWLFRLREPGNALDLTRAPSLFVFMGAAGVAAPAASAALAAWVLHAHSGVFFWGIFWAWFSADALGLLIIVPLFAGTHDETFTDTLRSAFRLEALAIPILILGLTAVLMGGEHYSWIFLLGPLFLWATFRFGFMGVAAGIFLATAGAIAALALAPQGAHLADIRGEVRFLQVFLFTNVLIFLPIASLLRSLRASESQFRLLFEKTPMGLAIVESTSGRFLSVNPRLGEILGYAPEALLEGHFQNVTHSEHLVGDLESVRELLSGAVPEVQKEKRYLHRSGRIVWARLKMVRLPSSPGMPARHLSLVEDITEAHQAQAAQNEALDRLQKIANRVPGVVYQLRKRPDGSSCIPYASEALLEIYRIHPEEVREDAAKMKAALHPDDREGVASSIRASAADLSPWKHEYRIKFEDGTIRSLYADSVPQKEEDGSILWTGFITDITDRKHMEAQLLQAQRMESLGILAGGVAHDMNNVLGAILSLASAHLSIQPRESPCYPAFETIRDAANRGGEMVKRLLNFARQSPSESRSLELNDLLLEQVRLLERTTLSKVHLALDLAKDLHPIRGDASALTHAFMNLCVNAVDAMEEGGTLTLLTRNVGQDRIEVMVEDTGCGMTQEVLEKATVPFFTTKEMGKGTGLGLSMVYTTVKAHNGQLVIESEPGKGTRVKLFFPVTVTRDLGPERAVQARLKASDTALKVLLVDDDDLILRSTRMLVEVLGHTVTSTLNGEDALALIEDGFRPDVVILDMNMPGLGGRGTLPRLRALCPSVPVLLATGRADQEALALIAAHPHVALLSKPFSIQDLHGHLLKVGG